MFLMQAVQQEKLILCYFKKNTSIETDFGCTTGQRSTLREQPDEEHSHHDADSSHGALSDLVDMPEIRFIFITFITCLIGYGYNLGIMYTVKMFHTHGMNGLENESDE